MLALTASPEGMLSLTPRWRGPGGWGGAPGGARSGGAGGGAAGSSGGGDWYGGGGGGGSVKGAPLLPGLQYALDSRLATVPEGPLRCVSAAGARAGFGAGARRWVVARRWAIAPRCSLQARGWNLSLPRAPASWPNPAPKTAPACRRDLESLVPAPVTLYSFYDPSPWDAAPTPAPVAGAAAAPAPGGAKGAGGNGAAGARRAGGNAPAAPAAGPAALSLLCHQSLGRINLALELLRRGQE